MQKVDSHNTTLKMTPICSHVESSLPKNAWRIFTSPRWSYPTVAPHRWGRRACPRKRPSHALERNKNFPTNPLGDLREGELDERLVSKTPQSQRSRDLLVVLSDSIEKSVQILWTKWCPGRPSCPWGTSLRETWQPLAASQQKKGEWPLALPPCPSQPLTAPHTKWLLRRKWNWHPLVHIPTATESIWVCSLKDKPPTNTQIVEDVHLPWSQVLVPVSLYSQIPNIVGSLWGQSRKVQFLCPNTGFTRNDPKRFQMVGRPIRSKTVFFQN